MIELALWILAGAAFLFLDPRLFGDFCSMETWSAFAGNLPGTAGMPAASTESSRSATKMPTGPARAGPVFLFQSNPI
jgi:hypothetical protein